MRLVEFKSGKDKVIYINPDYVESVEKILDDLIFINMAVPDGNGDNIVHKVFGSLDEVVQKLRNAR